MTGLTFLLNLRGQMYMLSTEWILQEFMNFLRVAGIFIVSFKKITSYNEHVPYLIL